LLWQGVNFLTPNLHFQPLPTPTSQLKVVWELGFGIWEWLEVGGWKLGVVVQARGGGTGEFVVLITRIATPIIEATSAALAGITRVLLSLASRPNCVMYCSATRS